MARRCCEVWLRSVIETVPAEARDLIRQAADHYGRAFQRYDSYRSEVKKGEPEMLSLQDRARKPERIATIVPVLGQGIVAETAGLEAMRKCVGILDSEES